MRNILSDQKTPLKDPPLQTKSNTMYSTDRFRSSYHILLSVFPSILIIMLHQLRVMHEVLMIEQKDQMRVEELAKNQIEFMRSNDIFLQELILLLLI